MWDSLEEPQRTRFHTTKFGQVGVKTLGIYSVVPNYAGYRSPKRQIGPLIFSQLPLLYAYYWKYLLRRSQVTGEGRGGDPNPQQLVAPVGDICCLLT